MAKILSRYGNKKTYLSTEGISPAISTIKLWHTPKDVGTINTSWAAQYLSFPSTTMSAGWYSSLTRTVAFTNKSKVWYVWWLFGKSNMTLASWNFITRFGFTSLRVDIVLDSWLKTISIPIASLGNWDNIVTAIWNGQTLSVYLDGSFYSSISAIWSLPYINKSIYIWAFWAAALGEAVEPARYFRWNIYLAEIRDEAKDINYVKNIAKQFFRMQPIQKPTIIEPAPKPNQISENGLVAAYNMKLIWNKLINIAAPSSANNNNPSLCDWTNYWCVMENDNLRVISKANSNNNFATRVNLWNSSLFRQQEFTVCFTGKELTWDNYAIPYIFWNHEWGWIGNFVLAYRSIFIWTNQINFTSPFINTENTIVVRYKSWLWWNVFVNWVSIANILDYWNISYSANATSIWAHNETNTYSTNQRIRDLRYYNRYLSDTEIKNYHNKRSSRPALIEDFSNYSVWEEIWQWKYWWGNTLKMAANSRVAICKELTSPLWRLPKWKKYSWHSNSSGSISWYMRTIPQTRNFTLYFDAYWNIVWVWNWMILCFSDLIPRSEWTIPSDKYKIVFYYHSTNNWQISINAWWSNIITISNVPTINKLARYKLTVTTYWVWTLSYSLDLNTWVELFSITNNTYSFRNIQFYPYSTNTFTLYNIKILNWIVVN